jgi:hypothetical protein
MYCLDGAIRSRGRTESKPNLADEVILWTTSSVFEFVELLTS